MMPQYTNPQTPQKSQEGAMPPNQQHTNDDSTASKKWVNDFFVPKESCELRTAGYRSKNECELEHIKTDLNNGLKAIKENCINKHSKLEDDHTKSLLSLRENISISIEELTKSIERLMDDFKSISNKSIDDNIDKAVAETRARIYNNFIRGVVVIAGLLGTIAGIAKVLK